MPCESGWGTLVHEIADRHWHAAPGGEFVPHLDQSAHQWRSESERQLRMDGSNNRWYRRHRLVLSLKQSHSRLRSGWAWAVQLLGRIPSTQRSGHLVPGGRKLPVYNYYKLLSL